MTEYLNSSYGKIEKKPVPCRLPFLIGTVSLQCRLIVLAAATEYRKLIKTASRGRDSEKY
jgi:hypothetical protein